MLELTSFYPMFATPMMRFEMADHAVFDASLLHEADRMRADSVGVAKSNRRGWHSEGNLFSQDAPVIARLRQAAEEAVQTMMQRISPKLDLKTLDMSLFGWINVSGAGAYNAPHTHPGAHWSGVYYVTQPGAVDGDSGMIEFLDPRSDLPNWRMLKGKCFQPKFRLRPASGEIILFPSYLVHWVHPNESDEDRVSVAFNATFRRWPSKAT